MNRQRPLFINVLRSFSKIQPITKFVSTKYTFEHSLQSNKYNKIKIIINYSMSLLATQEKGF